MSRAAQIVCAGYSPLDVTRTSSGTIARRAGGTAGNVAAILSFLGWRGVLAAQIGDDSAADELVADLDHAGVDTTGIRRASATLTARVLHDIRPDGHFFRYSCPDCSSSFPRTRPLTLDHAEECVEAFPRPTVYFFDRANAGTVWLAEQYERRGSVIVFEPSMPANAELLFRAAAVAHVLKHSDDRSVGGLDDLHVKPRRGQVRVVTHGAEGLDVRVGRARARHLPALATLAVDTGGAGDWTTAGLLAKATRAGFVDREALDRALRFGQALAAVNCAVPGARGAMRLTRGSVVRRVRGVLKEDGLSSEPRVPSPPPLVHHGGACPSCAMPMAPSSRQHSPSIADLRRSPYSRSQSSTGQG